MESEETHLMSKLSRFLLLVSLCCLWLIDSADLISLKSRKMGCDWLMIGQGEGEGGGAAAERNGSVVASDWK
jgi:hypothetical protein